MANKIETFEDLDIWKKSVELYVEIFQVCEEGKLAKDFTAKDQMKRAALSISNNIAEGFEYENNLQFMRYLRYSKGSAGEVRSMLYIALDLEYITKEDFDIVYNASINIITQISNFIRYLRVYSIKKNIDKVKSLIIQIFIH